MGPQISTMNGGSALVPNLGLGSPMITLPSIPNPTPPPPKKVAVVTPALARGDLAQKQGVMTQLTQAVGQQTANKLQNSFGQPISQAPGSPVPTTGTAQPGATQGAPAQSTAPAGTAQQTTQVQPATAAQQPTSPTATQVTLPNGVKANYDSATGQVSTLDGKALIFDKASNSWVDPSTSQPPTPMGTTGNSTTGAPSTGDPTSDYVIGQLQQNQAQSDANAASFQASMQQLLNGTVPLTADQQAQVSSIQSAYDRLKTQQQTENDNYVKGTKLFGIRTGQQQYQPGEYNQDVQDAVDEGIQKVADLDIKAAGAIADLRSGFMDNDYKIINASYGALQDAITQKNDSLAKIQTAVANAVSMQTQRIQQQKAYLDIQKETVDSVAQSALKAAMGVDGQLDLDVIASMAAQNGVDPNALYGAVRAAQQDEIKFQQDETKFSTDQLQAAAQLEATKASTASSRATTAKTYADMAASQGVNASALAAQPGYNKLSSAQKTIVDGTNNLVAALKEYKDKYSALVDKSGGNYFGSDAAELGSLYHSLIFQYSVAAGSGAIQKADAEQIQQIIPDPTSVSGIVGSALKGGKVGGEKALDSQINKFTDSLKTYGLKPIATSDTASSTPAPTYEANGVTYVKGADNLYYPQQ